MFVNSS